MSTIPLPIPLHPPVTIATISFILSREAKSSPVAIFENQYAVINRQVRKFGKSIKWIFEINGLCEYV